MRTIEQHVAIVTSCLHFENSFQSCTSASLIISSVNIFSPLSIRISLPLTRVCIFQYAGRTIVFASRERKTTLFVIPSIALCFIMSTFLFHHSSPLLFYLLRSPFIFLALSPGSTTGTSISWMSPAAGSAYAPGDVLVAQWSSAQPISSPSFRLCINTRNQDRRGNHVERPTNPIGTHCGDASQPHVKRSAKSYHVSL